MTDGALGDFKNKIKNPASAVTLRGYGRIKKGFDNDRSYTKTLWTWSTNRQSPRRRSRKRIQRDPCPDHPHDQNNHWNCIGCRSEILAGDRPADKQGKPLAPKGPAIPAPAKEPQ